MAAKTQLQRQEQGSNTLRLGAAAALVGVSRPTLALAVDRGDLSGEWQGKQRVVRRAGLLAWASIRAKSRPKRSPKRAGGKLVREITRSLSDGYAIGGYSVITARHPNYVRASTATTIWTTKARFAEIVGRSRPADVLRDANDAPVGVWRFSSSESVRVLLWPEALGNLVTERSSVDRSLTADRLLATFAIEQVLRARVESADLETLAVLVLERRVDLAGVLDLFDRVAATADCLVIPLGTRSSSIVETSLADTVQAAKWLVASVLRRIADVGTTNPFLLVHRGELRPLGRSKWREIIRQVKPANIDQDRLLSLVGSV
jgi:hypothetical protein